MSYKRFIVGFDIHGDKSDPSACEAFFKFQESHWKADIRICGGDLWDFRPLRRKANEEERRESMAEDFQAGMKWFQRFKPTYFVRGNHDERLWDLAQEDRGVLSDYAHQGVDQISDQVRKMRCKMLPWHKRDGVLRLGHLKIIHGYLCGITAARRTALVYGSVLMGHGHAVQSASIEGLEQRTGMMCGCLCSLDFDYNRASLGSLTHEHGWAYGIINEKTGSYHVWQARRIDSKWIIPSDVVQL